MTIQEAKKDTIAVLNSIVRLRLEPSPIHGVGVFAIYDIPKGSKLYATMFPQAFWIPFKDFDKIKPKIRQLILERWPKVVTEGRFMYPDTLLQGYMNHSDDPNYNNLDDTAIRDIYAGEEVLADYRNIPTWRTVFPWLKSK